MSLLMILILLLIGSFIFGGIGHSHFGYAGWSPVGIILIILAVLFFTGHLGRWH
jgi:hypothetical protein